MKKSVALMLGLAVAVSAVRSYAQSPADAAQPPAAAASSAINIAAPDNDKTNYLSDRITFQFATYVQRLDMTSQSTSASPGCAPAGTSFKGIGTGVVEGTKNPLFIITFVPSAEAEAAKSQGINRCTSSATRVQLGDVVLVRQADLLVTPPDRFGLTYGTLLIPFKYHLRGDKDFSGGSSLGGYLGFRQDRSGVTGLALQYVAFLGAANVSVPQTVNGQDTTQNMTGVSYGLGIIGTVKDAFHMGLVLGADRVNASANFKNNGKPWLAVSLGFDFSN